MKRLTWALLTVVLAATILFADDHTRLYSDPSLPPREVLDRLNLKQAWSTYIPMDGRKDGFVSIHLIDGQMFVQTRSGAVSALDAETGRTLWSATFGKSYQASFPLALNSYAVYAVNGGTLFALDRATGKVQWKFRQPQGMSAGPIADDQQMYLCTGNGLMYAYFVPTPAPPILAKNIDKPDTAPTSEKKSADSLSSPSYTPSAEPAFTAVREPQPTYAWDTQTNIRLEYVPLQSRETVLMPSPTGTLLGLSKYPVNSVVPEVYRIKLDGDIAVPPGHYEDLLKNGGTEDTAYVGTQDGKVYAYNISGGKQRWRFTVGNMVSRSPLATDEDVYVTAEGNGLFRLNRATGEPQWRIKRGNRVVEGNPDADRVIAVNPKFVYATDKSGRLLVLDRALGGELSSYDVRDFVFPINNDMNDRLYLAANNGLIICLHDREYTKPVFHQKQIGGGPAARSPEELKRIALENLARKITDNGSRDPVSLRDALDKLRRNYNVRIFCSDRAFTSIGKQPVNDKLVTVPKVMELPLGDFIKQIVGQVGATYELTGDVIQIIPAADKNPPMPPMPMPMPPAP